MNAEGERLEAEKVIRAELAQLRLQMEAAKRPYQERFDYLWDVLRGPTVIPVLHFARWRDIETEDHWEGSLVGAFRALLGMIDCESGSPEGVSVNGCYISWDNWGKHPLCPPDFWDS